ncbi:hypothetical protein B0H16DRAFT_1473237 [Mycena metata]|uniref:Uncharacterized protein n=1 Tax=Mycena metata TaxID=1033252 RepID=A0AAD7MLG9_9AGAR|nr:hypothetical protein B0H16DRAFT_1473237 [Mycena metata]
MAPKKVQGVLWRKGSVSAARRRKIQEVVDSESESDSASDSNSESTHSLRSSDGSSRKKKKKKSRRRAKDSSSSEEGFNSDSSDSDSDSSSDKKKKKHKKKSSHSDKSSGRQLVVVFDPKHNFWTGSGHQGIRNFNPGMEKILKYINENNVAVGIFSSHYDVSGEKEFFNTTRVKINGERRTLMSFVKPGCFLGTHQGFSCSRAFDEIGRRCHVKLGDMLAFMPYSECAGPTCIQLQGELDWEAFKAGIAKFRKRR